MVLPLDSHFSMENVSYTKSGLLSTNIGRGDILEYNLLGVYNKSPNRYHTVENDTLTNYLTKSTGRLVFSDIPGKSQSLLKVFTFECFRESIKFSYMFIEMVQVITHHPVFYVNWVKVTINLHT